MRASTGFLPNQIPGLKTWVNPAVDTLTSSSYGTYVSSYDPTFTGTATNVSYVTTPYKGYRFNGNGSIYCNLQSSSTGIFDIYGVLTDNPGNGSFSSIIRICGSPTYGQILTNYTGTAQGALFYAVCPTEGNSVISAAVNVLLKQGIPQLYRLTVNYNTKIITGYINGVLIGTATIPCGFEPTPILDARTSIGTSSIVNNNGYVNGVIHEILIYEKALANEASDYLMLKYNIHS
jgi:hypothetical protein